MPRSPDPENANPSMGGWGLDIGNDSKDKKANDEQDDDDDSLDWEAAQVCHRVLRMSLSAIIKVNTLSHRLSWSGWLV